MRAETTILGIDPGFASFGIALVRLLPDSEDVLLLEVLRTSKSTAKQNVFACSDNVRRARELAHRLEQIVTGHAVRAIAAESMSYPRNSSTAGKMSLAWGVIAAISEAHGLPVIQSSPQAIKQAVTGSKTADKAEVEFSVLRRFGNAIEALYGGPDGQREHAFDALAAIVACLDSDVMRALRPRECSPLSGPARSKSATRNHHNPNRKGDESNEARSHGSD